MYTHPQPLHNPVTLYPVNCICDIEETKTSQKSIIQCTICNIYYHKECLKEMSKMDSFICPKCQIIKGCIFYKILYTLLEPSLFELEYKKNNKSNYIFIPDNKSYTNNKKINNNPVFVLIRCLKFDKKGFSFHWPKRSKIYLNNKLILDFTIKGSKKQDRMICLVSKKLLNLYDNNGIIDYDKFRSENLIYDSNIIIIEDDIYDKKPNRFEINVNYIKEDNLENTNFALSIDCCEIIRDPKYIIQKVPIYKDKKILKELLTKNEAKFFLNNAWSLKEKISLMDIYTETEKIKLPARGINCCHLNVFDLKTFLILNRKTNKYECPYCKRHSNELYIDGIIMDFLNNKKTSNIQDILIDKDYNIISYIQKKNNILENDDINDMKKMEDFDVNKKVKINLNSNRDKNLNMNTSINNKNFNTKCNFSQIFEMIRKERKTNKNNNILYIGKSKYDNYYNSEHYFLNKYPKNNAIINHENSVNDIEKEIKYNNMIMPLDENEEVKDENKKEKKKEITYTNKNLNNVIFEGIFNNLFY